jgi:hypothetical protein
VQTSAVTRPGDLASAVERIALLGAPQAVLVDVEAIGVEDTPVGAQVRRLLTALGLPVVPCAAAASRAPGVADAPTLTGTTVAVFGSDHPPVADCHAWYVGAGPTPWWMHQTVGDGPRTSARILSLLGTGFVQERAGAAFRAAGARRPSPLSADYDADAILEGIGQDVAPRPSPRSGAASPPPPLDERTRQDLLGRAAEGLGLCCAPNGAISAVPPSGPGQGPDYGFFWQRDAAHAAFALRALAVSGPDRDVRGDARRRLDAYVSFVAKLGLALEGEAASIAAGRCTLTGEPVGGYGDPQPDGPAATALAILSAVEDPRAALAIARPFLDYLLISDAGGPAYDLWELRVGTSFHAVNLGRRALRRAARVAGACDHSAAVTYRRGASEKTLRLNAFRDSTRGGIVHMREPGQVWFSATSGLDMSVIGSLLLGYDVADEVFNVDDRDVASTMRRLESHFAGRWPINDAWQLAGRSGGGMGRFPEDCNDGIGSTHGSPWPVTTLWAAQYHLRRAQRSAHLASADPLDRAREAARALDYLSFVLAHTDVAAIGEQIDGVTGLTRGARPLAWSHAELVTTLIAVEPWTAAAASRPA